MIHVKGVDNPLADLLSRDPSSTHDSNESVETVIHVAKNDMGSIQPLRRSARLEGLPPGQSATLTPTNNKASLNTQNNTHSTNTRHR